MKTYYILPLILLCGCASILHGTNDQINVNSLEKGTTIYIDGAPRGENNAIAEVKRGSSHTIRAEKSGCQDIAIDTTRSFDPASLLGVLIDFGIITIPLDFIMGGAMKTEPTTYTVTPICKK